MCGLLAWTTASAGKATAGAPPSPAYWSAMPCDEEDGSFSGYCVYEASGPDALRRHGEAMKLPTDAIKPVVSTIVVSGDPEPVAAV